MNKKNRLNNFEPNILIVDDVAINLQVLGDILEDAGYKVRPVLSGMMAMQVALKEKPDLILSDIMMPDMNGFELCHNIKENPLLSDIPIIFISALNDTDDIVKALNSGASDYITKPFREGEVKARVATHLKLYQQKNQLQELNATKDKFFSIIAHDLKNPLGNFRLMTQMLHDSFEEFNHEELMEFLNMMKISSSNIYNLLENLLEWSRSQRGSIRFEPVESNLYFIVENIIQLLKTNSDYKRISFVNKINKSTMLEADVNLLNTILRNLLSNAIKFTQNEGMIEIGCSIKHLEDFENPEDYHEIYVKDNGVGMNQIIKDNLFRIDKSVTTSGTNNEKGTGLGLILCKEFVEMHDGKIWVESEIGKGSIFYFTIP